MIRNLRTLALTIAACLLPLTATAGSYPDKPITLICPYSAGGGGDTASRMIAKLAGDMMGVKIIVENKTGGGATIGIGAVAKAKPDGYTIGFISTSPITIRPHMMKAPYKPLEDLSYISQHWNMSEYGNCSGAELTGDGKVDLQDYALFAENWLSGAE